VSEARRTPSASGRSPLIALIDRVLPRLKHPYLLLFLGGLLLVDIVVPTPPPLIDEIILALLTFLVATWRTRKEPEQDLEPKDVTPKEAQSPASLPAESTQDEASEQGPVISDQ
jgi:hypothetical protein